MTYLFLVVCVVALAASAGLAQVARAIERRLPARQSRASRSFELREPLPLLGKAVLVLCALAVTIALALRAGTTSEVDRLSRFCIAMRTDLQLAAQGLRESRAPQFMRKPELRWVDFGLCGVQGMASMMRRRLERCAETEPDCAAQVFADLAVTIR
jgi:hypothetical protein